MSAEEHKLEGNKFYKSKDYLKAVKEYSKACKLDATNHVFPSNLAQALLCINKFKQALAAAESCIAIKADFDKGHFRRAQALEGLERMDEAAMAYVQAARVNPGNVQAVTKAGDIAVAIAAACENAGQPTPDSIKELLEEVNQLDGDIKAKEREAKQRADEAKEAQQRKRDATQAKAEDELLSQKAELAEQARQSSLALHESSQRMKNQGHSTPYKSDRIQRFVAAEIEGLRDPANAHQFQTPLAIVLPGAVSEEWGDEGCGVAINSAFESPDNHSEAQAFLRSHAENCGAHAILLIVKKSLISFPRMWTGKGKAELVGEDGYFVQLQTLEPADREIWWLGMNESGGWVQEALEYEHYQLMGTLLRKEE